LKVEKQKLIDKLNLLFEEYSVDKVIREKIIDSLKNRNMMIGDIYGILNKTISLLGLDYVHLYIITKAVYDAIDKEAINPKKFFTDVQIEKYSKFKIEKRENKKYPINFKSVIKISEDHYVTKLSAQEITNMYKKRIIVYNPETQRPLKDSGDIDINMTSVKEIGENILAGKQISNFITLNLLENGEEELIYDENRMELTIFNGELDIPDGFHRSMGIKYATDENPDVQFVIGVNLTNFDIDKTRRFIVQEDKRNQINKRYIESIDPENLANKVIRKLNEPGKCDLAGKIATSAAMINSGRALTLTDIMSKAITHNFKLETSKDAYDVGKWLIEFFNILIGTYPDEFLNNIYLTKEESYINHRNSFIGYIAIASKLQKRNNWVEYLYEAMGRIDFSKDNSEWKSIGLTSNKMSSKFIKKVSDYFSEKIQ